MIDIISNLLGGFIGGCGFVAAEKALRAAKKYLKGLIKWYGMKS
jgi:hypothetical protein